MAEGNVKIILVEYPEGAMNGEFTWCELRAINIGELDDCWLYISFVDTWGKQYIGGGKNRYSSFAGLGSIFRMHSSDAIVTFQTGHWENDVVVIDDEQIKTVKILNSKINWSNIEIN